MQKTLQDLWADKVRLLQGAAAGFVLTVIVGFDLLGYGFGWTTGGSVQNQVAAGVSKALVQVCADILVLDKDAVADLQKTHEADWDDAVMRHIKKVGALDISTSDRPFAMACGKEVLARNTGPELTSSSQSPRTLIFPISLPACSQIRKNLKSHEVASTG